MNAASTSFPAPRVAPNPRHAFGGIWRLTYRRLLSPSQWLSIGGMLALLLLLTFSVVPRGRADAFFDWTAGFYIGFAVPVLAFLSGAGAIRDEMKAGSVDYVLTRPVWRPAFVVFKYLAHMACTQVVYLLALGALVAIGFFRDTPGLAAALPMLFFTQVLTITAFVALGFFCAVLTSRYLILGLLYAGIVEVGIGHIPTQLGRLSMTQQIHGLLEPLMDGNRLLVASGDSPFTVALLLLGVSTALVASAAIYFSLQEFAGARSTEL
jgi:ABC-2 type transport system permease protein